VSDACPPINPLAKHQGDINSDGRVDLIDFAILAENGLVGVD
jgi:hypothetical protein